jgi:hypothetical protein
MSGLESNAERNCSGTDRRVTSIDWRADRLSISAASKS